MKTILLLASMLALAACEENPQGIHESRDGHVCMIWAGTFAMPIDCSDKEKKEEGQ